MRTQSCTNIAKVMSHMRLHPVGRALVGRRPGVGREVDWRRSGGGSGGGGSVGRSRRFVEFAACAGLLRGLLSVVRAQARVRRRAQVAHGEFERCFALRFLCVCARHRRPLGERRARGARRTASQFLSSSLCRDTLLSARTACHRACHAREYQNKERTCEARILAACEAEW